MSDQDTPGKRDGRRPDQQRRRDGNRGSGSDGERRGRESGGYRDRREGGSGDRRESGGYRDRREGGGGDRRESGGYRDRREGGSGDRRESGGYRDRRGGSSQRPSERGRTGDPARLAAYTVLRAVAEGAYANLELPAELRRRRLRGRDAGFATELTYGTIRMRGFYDAVIAAAAEREISRIDGAILDTLRLGVHQFLGMRVPDHAAAAATVALARQVNGAGAASFVNAVLRRVSEHNLEQWRELVVPDEDGAARWAVEYSHPEWVIRALRQALLGHGTADPTEVDQAVQALLAADNARPSVQLVARPGLTTVAELVAQGAEASPLSRYGAELPEGDPGYFAEVRDGRAAVQDVGSQLVALTLAAAPVAADGPERWLDLCAGPGGKAGLLAGLAADKGADLVANEISAHRSELVRKTLTPAIERAEALGLTLQVRTGDGREIGNDEPGVYHRVLVDAPCTGLGALRRRPEARWRRTPDDLAGLGPLQRELLRSALDACAPGGVVAYATCSPHLAETTFVVSDVTKGRSDVEVIDTRSLVTDVHGAALPDTGSGPGAQLWTHLHGTDSMYVCLIRKN